MTTFLPAILPIGTPVSIETSLKCKNLEGHIAHYYPTDDEYEVIDGIGCMWTRCRNEITVLSLPSLQARIDAAIKVDSHSPAATALACWKCANAQGNKAAALAYLEYATGCAKAGENNADLAILAEAKAAVEAE